MASEAKITIFHAVKIGGDSILIDNELKTAAGDELVFPANGGTLATLDDIPSTSSTDSSREMLDEVVDMLITRSGEDYLDLRNMGFTGTTWLSYRFAGGKFKQIVWSRTNPPRFAEATDASYMFYNCYSLTSISFPSSTTFAALTNASYMFSGCRSLRSVSFPEGVTFNEVTNAGSMFQGCSSLASVSFPTSTTFAALTSGGGMFSDCPALYSISMSGVAATKLKSRSSTGLTWDITPTNDSTLHFYRVINKHITAEMTEAPVLETYTDEGTTAITTADFTGDNNNKYDRYTMANTCTITAGNNKFLNASSLVHIDLSKLVLDNSCTSLAGMFQSCYSLQFLQFPYNITFDHVSDASSMFKDCHSLPAINFPTSSKISLLNASYMFYNCHRLPSISFPENSKFDSTTDTSYMFGCCYSLSSISFSVKTEFRYVTNASHMFNSCYSLTSIPFPCSTTFAALTNAAGMFANCISLRSAVFPSGINFNKVTNAGSMFNGCSSLVSVSFSVSTTFAALTNCDGMFSYCTSLSSISMSGVAATKLKSLLGSDDAYWMITPTNDEKKHTYECFWSDAGNWLVITAEN